MTISKDKIDKFLSGESSADETMDILSAIAVDQQLEEYVVTNRRMAYTNEQMEDYGSFIPVSSMAADDGKNLCDFQCEAYIIKKAGHKVEENALALESKRNYWLRSEGTPLFNMGKLLEHEGFLVNRQYNATIDDLEMALKEYSVIVVVNGKTLSGEKIDVFSENYNFDDNPNHAVVVLAIDKTAKRISIYNPANDEESSIYDLETFENAWAESRNYMVTARKKSFAQEYNPQPVDVSKIKLNNDMEELIEVIAENAHDTWAVDKFKEGYAYAPLDKDGHEEKGHNHYLVPYFMLDENDKEPDRRMATSTIKLIKRLGYRLVNINSMYRCPDCGEVIEPSDNFCHNCGRQLSWKDFR